MARNLPAHLGQFVPDLGLVLLGTGQLVQVKAGDSAVAQLTQDTAARLARQIPEYAGAEAIVIEDCVRGR